MKATSTLAIGGLDPSGGAGLGMDRVTAAARGVWSRLVASAVTAQDGRAFRGAWPLPPDALQAQLDSALADGTVTAIKIGMLPNAAAVRIVARTIERVALPCVLDPILRSSSAGELIDDEGRRALQDELLPRVSLITPNLPEAAALTSLSVSQVQTDPLAAGRALIAAGARAVLLKGGHAQGARAADWFVAPGAEFALETRRLLTQNARGTGCCLASAIAAELALGVELTEAVRAAKLWFDATLADGVQLEFGPAPGPLPVLGETLRSAQAGGGQGRSLRS